MAANIMSGMSTLRFDLAWHSCSCLLRKLNKTVIHWH